MNFDMKSWQIKKRDHWRCWAIRCIPCGQCVVKPLAKALALHIWESWSGWGKPHCSITEKAGLAVREPENSATFFGSPIRQMTNCSEDSSWNGGTAMIRKEVRLIFVDLRWIHADIVGFQHPSLRVGLCIRRIATKLFWCGKSDDVLCT